MKGRNTALFIATAINMVVLHNNMKKWESEKAEKPPPRKEKPAERPNEAPTPSNMKTEVTPPPEPRRQDAKTRGPKALKDCIKPGNLVDKQVWRCMKGE